ncbi:hypothetical protein ACFQL1_01775 [Halomicroarcula sp. GCM10025709]|uniref:helix-turn-helix transcriptional regulator n=1 Tax=Haloarcula TaxID=2237 RepID=UPI0024C27053|nr:helix-turn-helix transcriptional regulator [Halomicroarcula sp. YJ-61-S]
MCPSGGPDLETDFETATFESADSVPAPDALFRALAHRQRRRLLATLVSTDRSAVADLVDVLAGWESTEDGPVGPDDWRTLRAQLLHSHLPLLDEAGLIDYDGAAGVVTLASVPEPVTELLLFANTYERTTSQLPSVPTDTDSA